MSLLSFSFVMIYIIHKVIVLLKNYLNYLKDSTFKCFFKEYNRLFFFFKKKISFTTLMMESLSLEEENIVKDIRNLFRLEKKTKAIKNRMLRDIENLFEHEEKDYYKPLIVRNFRSNNYTEYKRKGDRKTLSVEEYLNKIKPYLKDVLIINDHNRS